MNHRAQSKAARPRSSPRMAVSLGTVIAYVEVPGQTADDLTGIGGGRSGRARRCNDARGVLPSARAHRVGRLPGRRMARSGRSGSIAGRALPLLVEGRGIPWPIEEGASIDSIAATLRPFIAANRSLLMADDSELVLDRDASGLLQRTFGKSPSAAWSKGFRWQESGTCSPSAMGT